MYALGIDLGTASTTAAVCRDGRAELAWLGGDGPAIPSVVLLGEDGTLQAGQDLSRRRPDRVAREFVPRLGQPDPVVLAGTPVPVEQLIDRLLTWTVGEVSRREGGPPARICLSHPSGWGPYHQDQLGQLARRALAGVPVRLVTGPQAAAEAYARQQPIATGALVAVYELGGASLDTAVLRRTTAGFEILGQPAGVPRLASVDEVVVGQVQEALGSAFEALDPVDREAATAQLRQQCGQATQALSTHPEVTVPVALPAGVTQVRLTRAELAAQLRPLLLRSVAVLRRVLRSAPADLAEVHLVLLAGDAVRMPPVAEAVAAELGRAVVVYPAPEQAVAVGAAWLASAAPAARVAVPAAPAERSAPTAPAVSDAAAAALTAPTVTTPTLSAVSAAGAEPGGGAATVMMPLAGIAAAGSASGRSGSPAGTGQARHPAPAPGSGAGGGRPRRGRWALLIGAVVLVALVAVGVITMLAGGSGLPE